MGAALSGFSWTWGASAPTREGAGGPDTTKAAPGTESVPTSKAPSAVSVNQTDVEDDAETGEPDLGLCGFPPDLDFSRWEEVPLEPRIKESRLTSEQKTKFRGHLDRIFHPDTIKGVRLQFDPADILEVVEAVMPYLKSESMLIEDVPFGVVVVADLHGQLYDLNRVFKADEKDGKPGWECQKYVFLGDYVDRGRQSLEIVMALFSIKMLYPDRIFLLRGNHEYLQANCRYGFAFDFYDRYSEEETWKGLFFKVNESFCYLSAAAIVGEKHVLLRSWRHLAKGLHQGVFASDKKADGRIAIRRDDSRCELGGYRNGLAWVGIQRWSIYFGLNVLSKALYNMDCKMIIRGHTMLEKGYDLIGNLCVSIFSATGTQDFNDGAVAVIGEQGQLTIRVLQCNKERVAWVNKLKRRDGATANNSADPPTVYGKEDAGDGRTPAFNNK